MFKKFYLILCLLLLTSVSHAGLLDILQHGVPGNPDVYASLELVGTKSHDAGTNVVPSVSAIGQASQANSQGMRGQFTLPMDDSTSFLLGGSFSTYSYDYSPTNEGLYNQNGHGRSFSIEAGFRFYIHN
jgi:hypothetical protein